MMASGTPKKRMPRTRNFIAPHDPELERLKSDLDYARRAILRLMSEPAQDILKRYYQCESRAALYKWQSSVVDQLADLAKPLPRRSGYEGERAYCPLCGGSPEDFYNSQRGFSLPLGLERHLSGFGNTHQCDVTVAAFGLALDWAHDKFQESERRQDAEAEAQIAKRKVTETLYRTGPDGEPELMGCQYQWRPVRDKEGLAWAEERLDELGFKATLDDRVKSYTQEHPGVIVYADPREEGRIEFRIFRFPLPPAPRKSRRGPDFRLIPQFTVMDAWKHDLPQKYAARLAEAMQRLTASKPASHAVKLSGATVFRGCTE
jgi:hypothetical protein